MEITVFVPMWLLVALGIAGVIALLASPLTPSYTSNPMVDQEYRYWLGMIWERNRQAAKPRWRRIQ